MAEQDLDRNEAATLYKLQKAREQGRTPRSVDAISSVAFLAGMLYLAGQGLSLADSLLQIAQATLLQAAQAQPGRLWPLMERIARETGAALLPLLLVLPVAAVLAAVAQTGVVFSTEPLRVDFDRINPATGLKRLLSMRTLFDALRACLKLLLLSLAAALALRQLLPQFHVVSALPPTAFLHTLVEDITGLGIRMGAALVLVSAIDILYTRREFARNMRMSQREIKDEHKNREGDPRLRGRLRELRRELLKRSLALRNTRSADVVLTNPTHYAVALRYVHGEMDAPRLVAKGAGQLAAAMREIAARHRIVVVQNPPLTRRLFREVPIDGSLPPDFHCEVARIIVWVLALRQQHRTRGGGARA